MNESSDDPALAVEATLPSGSAPTEPRPGLEYRELKGRVRSALFGASADPVKIARFAVLRRLGSGGMGVVYSAYDDELDRKVAIKLLRPDLLGDEGQQRLRREAQAVAKLSHPNVVGVFESGVHDGRVFVAMEFVHGRTLGAWLRVAPHGWAHIVDIFLQAGQGLLAAHAAGLVHRDFKPDNVMVGDDGRVRVLDFGVARAVALPDAATERGDGPGALSASALTVTGAVVGTPAYMAPEQLAGETADARTDQYAFCLTLWEALFEESAFAPTDPVARARAKAAGEIRSPTHAGRAPTRIRRLLVRGLSPRREDRWPGMEQLLAALSAARRRPRRWAAAALVAGFVGTASAAWLGARNDDCPSPTVKLRDVWNDDVRARVVEALRGTVEAGVGDAWLRLEPALDEYATQWRSAYASACDDDAPDEEFGLQRRLCLAAQLRRFGDLTQSLASGDVTQVKTAAGAVPEWPQPAACHDREYLRTWAEDEARRNAAAPKGSEAGLVSDFEGEPWTQFGSGWIDAVDTLAGGDSEVEIGPVEGGANGSGHAMRIAGVVREHDRDCWAGAMFLPGATPMAPANLSDKQHFTFAVRGDPGGYAVMVFSQANGWEPEIVPFAVDAEWKPVDIALSELRVERYEVTALFIGRVDGGRFELFVDDVRLE